MENLTIHGKIVYLEGGKSSTGRYRTTCVIKAKDFKRHKEQIVLSFWSIQILQLN